MGAAFVYGYGKEPCFQAALAAEFFQAKERGEEDVLGDVFDVARPSKQPVGQGRDIVGVLPDDGVEGRIVAPVKFSDEEFIIIRFGHDRYIRPISGVKLTGNFGK